VAWPRVFAVTGDEPRDLTPHSRGELREAAVSVTADGRTAASTWQVREARGQTGYGIALIDVESGTVTPLREAGDPEEYTSPLISPDGRHFAAIRRDRGAFDRAVIEELVILRLDGGGAAVPIGLGDVRVDGLAWSGDGGTLIVAGDLHGRGALLAVDAETWSVRTLADDAVYGSLCVDHTGAHVYALRSGIDRPPHPVRVDAGGTVTELPAPDPALELPGTLTEIEAGAPDGTRLRAWLCLPYGASAERPVPVQQWIHGGPFSSYNRWNWRSCPWVAVARGYAVILPDPALSTGYGPQWIERGWPHRAAVVWADVQAILGAALTRDDLDGARTGLFGASFGGFMTNWIAGHTDRFKAIVTHAGLWALEQEHTTTDLASLKQRVWGDPVERPEWFAENSPHYSASSIRTPVLVVHGNRDYRVPVSEALRLWWDLVHHFPGAPDRMPHRFLQFTTENHWILSPANAKVWYETVHGFMDQHVRG
jgi:dipeptidyl aminopeptidase/acylaminoacyl peptidase